MIYLRRKCGLCHRNSVKYFCFIQSNTNWYEICDICLMKEVLKNSSSCMVYTKIHFLDSFTGLGSFILYFIFTPFIIYDLFMKKH